MIGDEEEGIHIFNTAIQFHVINGVEDLISIIDHKQERDRSSESYDGAKNIIRDLNNSYKETRIKRDPTK